MDGEELPQITPAHLRRADDMCRRRLAREVSGGKRRANRSADMRFAVSNRVEADARLAQAEPGLPRAEAFVEPRELEPEQRALYRAAVLGYLDMFGAVPAQVVELPFRTQLPELGVELSSSPGIAADLADGRHELRKVFVGSSRGAQLLDAVDVRVALVRTEEWAPEHLDLVAVDVVQQRVQTATPDDTAAARERAHEWIGARVGRILELAADARPRAGGDCLGCAFVAGCSAHAR